MDKHVRGLRFLVVDDDDADCEAVRRCLLRGSFPTAQIDSVSTAAEAIEKVGSTRYDCLLVDYYLPDAHELSLVRMLRTAAMDVPLVMFTGRGDEDIAVELMKAGVADYVPKASLSPERLATAVRHARAIAAASRKRMEAEEALSRREAHLSAMINQTAAGVAETDLEGRFINVNDRYCEITGRGRAELLGLRMQDITHADDVARNMTLFAEAVESGQGFEIEKRYVHPDGSEVCVNNTVNLIRGPSGKPESVLAISIDISKRKQAEEQLRRAEAAARQAAEEAKAATELKSRFLAATNHDLRNPLHVLVGTLDRLKHILGDEPRPRKLLELANSAAERMQRAFEKLAEISELESGVLVPKRETFAIYPLLTSIYDLALPHAQERGLELFLEPCDALIVSDRYLLGSILENLVGNAIKYTSKGCVTIACREFSERLLVEVRDTGVGIPPEKLDEIFQEYSRLDPQRAEGLGLGLAIVAREAEMLGHRLKVESTVGAGSSFCIELPIA